MMRKIIHLTILLVMLISLTPIHAKSINSQVSYNSNAKEDLASDDFSKEPLSENEDQTESMPENADDECQNEGQIVLDQKVMLHESILFSVMQYFTFSSFYFKFYPISINEPPEVSA